MHWPTVRRRRSGPTVGSNRNRYPEGCDQRSRCGPTLPTSRQCPTFGVHLLQTNLAHVIDHLPLCHLCSDTAGKTGTDFITQLFQFKRGIGLLGGAVNHIHVERHRRYRSGRRRCLTQGIARDQQSHTRDLGERSQAHKLTFRCSLTSSTQLSIALCKGLLAWDSGHVYALIGIRHLKHRARVTQTGSTQPGREIAHAFLLSAPAAAG